MNTTMVDTKEVILALKRVKTEKNLSVDKILVLMHEKDPSTAVSKTTLARVFREGSENEIFRYEATLRPIANALLDIEEFESTDTPDQQAIKSILKLKKDLLMEMEEENNRLKEELKTAKLKYHEKLKVETDKYQKSLNFAMNQIELKDKRIDQLMSANDRLSITNDRLINQLMDCPLRNTDCKGED